jgi:XTP/dITP diphosphohydrolase
MVAQLVLATRNAGKRDELLVLLDVPGLELLTLDDLSIAPSVAEDGLEVEADFAANALAKARWFAAQLPGRVVVAEDSGLVVDALNGAPGVRSKRWSGITAGSSAAVDAANNALLARSLLGVSDRSARFVCAAACVWPGGEVVVEGTTEGRILTAARGTGGFGYDPWFWSVELEESFGTASASAKHRVSHRGRACASLMAELRRQGVLRG